MSSDLLKEFGVAERHPSNIEIHDLLVNEDDDFGDFEDPESVPKQVTSTNISQSYQDPDSVYSVREFNPQHLNRSHSTGHSNGGYVQETSDEVTEGSILFDAEQTFNERGKESDQSQIVSDQTHEKKPFKVSLLPVDQRKAVIKTKKLAPARVSEQYDFSQDDNWEPMETSKEFLTPSSVPEPDFEINSSQAVPVKPSLYEPPPSNIPPPSVLLSITTRHLESLPSDIRKIASAQKVSSEPLDPSQIDHVQKLLAITRAGAHCLAGRKLRWKRDSILSQSMKIGPAAGKSSGMKLVGVDKAESRREDQEAAEAVGAWRKHVGFLRTTVSTLNIQHSGKPLQLPDISENMPVRLFKPNEGAVSAPKACFLCGIKRDERVAKVDIDVEDSFGEWWHEHWGHVDCVAFWETNKSSLPQR